MACGTLFPGLSTAQKQLDASERCFQRAACGQRQNAVADLLQLNQKRVLGPLKKKRLKAPLRSADRSLRSGSNITR